MTSPPFTPALLSEVAFKRERDALDEYFPAFKIVERNVPLPYHVATGTLKPFDSLAQAQLVTANMLARIPLTTDYEGHLYPGDETLKPVRLRRSFRLLDPQGVEVVFVRAPDAHQVFLVSPSVDARSFPKLKHLYGRRHPGSETNPSLPAHEACVIAPSDRVWDRNTPVALLLNHVTRWIGAHRLVAFGGLEEWPTEEAPHSPEGWLAGLAPTDPCWCGRGLVYGACHRITDLSQTHQSFNARYSWLNENAALFKRQQDNRRTVSAMSAPG